MLATMLGAFLFRVYAFVTVASLLPIAFEGGYLKWVNLLLTREERSIYNIYSWCTHIDSHLGLVKVNSVHGQLFCILKKFQICLGWSHGSGEREEGLGILIKGELRGDASDFTEPFTH